MVPKFSVIIPVYNKGKFIKQCIESVLKQSLSEIEIICIDDCSSDDSKDIMYDYKKIDNRLFIYENDKNCGVSYTRNRGINLASGEFIFFLDADDRIEEETLEKYYCFAKENGIQMCFIKLQDSNLNKIVNIHKIYEHIYLGLNLLGKFVANNDNFLFACGAFYERKFIIDHNIQYKNMLIGEGGLFILNALLIANRVGVSDYIGYKYNINETSTSMNENSMKESAKGQLNQLLFMLKSLPEYNYDDSIICFLEWYIKRNIGGILNLGSETENVFKDSLNVEYDRFLTNLLCGNYLYKKIEITEKIQIEILKKKSVYIYGAGYNILSVIKYCNDIGVEIKKIFVTSLQKNKEYVYGFKVTEFKSEEIEDVTIPVIITTQKKHQNEIITILDKCGIKYVTGI